MIFAPEDLTLLFFLKLPLRDELSGKISDFGRNSRFCLKMAFRQINGGQECLTN